MSTTSPIEVAASPPDAQNGHADEDSPSPGIKRRPIRFGMENGIVLLTTIPAGEPVRVYGRESWVSA